MEVSQPRQGQIVEILENSPLYSVQAPHFVEKRNELEWYVKMPEYGLFDGILAAAHYGAENFKVGQRKGLKLMGKSRPRYVIKIDKAENRVFVGAGEDHPGLYRKVIFAPNEDVEWAEEVPEINSETSVIVKETMENAKLYTYEDGIFLEFEKPVKVFHFNVLNLLQNDKYIVKINLK